ncbi:MAG: AMP-binding protein [Candidatus Electryonea clarkiae]|nr:AMP-binding protein [Candidatus Electryonea clarkiae]MDP8286715.1 AMP-binding protein [Candidatus Electryonea clarkiae]
MTADNNLYELLLNRISETKADEPAIFWRDKSLSWKQVEYAARKVAGGLHSLGVQKGDRIAIMLPNIPPYIFIQFAGHLLGVSIVPIHIFTPASELGYLLDDSEAKVLFTWNGYHDVTSNALEMTESLRHCIEIGGENVDGVINFDEWINSAESYTDDPVGGGDNIAAIRYTSGVTGRPKGAMLSHSNILYNICETLQVLKLRKQEKILAAIPFFHPFGFTLQTYLSLFAGAELHLQTRFDPESALQAVASGKVSIIVGLPSHFTGIVEGINGNGEAGTLRFALSCGGPLDHSIINQFEKHFKTRIVTVYGTCETSPVIAINAAHLSETPREAWGRPISDLEIRIVNETGEEVPTDEIGEITVRSPGVFRGYWNRPDASKLAVDENGWFRTSDLGKIDLDGNLYGVGRLQNRINKGGYSVYPREVEGVLNAHPNIYASAVIGVWNSRFGEEIVAYIVPREGMTIDEKALTSYCTERLARYKSPNKFVFLTKLPRSPGGSILRRELREQWASRYERESQKPAVIEVIEPKIEPIEPKVEAEQDTGSDSEIEAIEPSEDTEQENSNNNEIEIIEPEEELDKSNDSEIEIIQPKEETEPDTGNGSEEETNNQESPNPEEN